MNDPNNDALMQMLLAQMLSGGDNGMGKMRQELAGYDALGPDGMRQRANLGTLDERGQLMQQQMAMAEALRQPQALNHSTVGGQIGAGLGNIVGAVGGGIKSRDLMAQQQGLLDQKDATRLSMQNAQVGGMRNYLADALRRGSQTPGQAQQPPAWDGMVSGQGLPPPLTDATDLDLGAMTPRKKPAMLTTRDGLPPPSFYGL